ncbi:MAG: hypothetical protein DRJ47_06095 [Thermoprotei archaeon]|nr:MAG: hypothetical protein DRJ47_06095 [Thermoprotei archaeon]
MDIEEQVVSVELAKRLKEVGVDQESLFYWASGSLLFFEEVDWSDVDDIYSAFTAVELMDLLPTSIGKNTRLAVLKFEDVWKVAYFDMIDGNIIGLSEKKKLADALAGLRIWLSIIATELEKAGYVEVEYAHRRPNHIV